MRRSAGTVVAVTLHRWIPSPYPTLGFHTPLQCVPHIMSLLQPDDYYDELQKVLTFHVFCCWLSRSPGRHVAPRSVAGPWSALFDRLISFPYRLFQYRSRPSNRLSRCSHPLVSPVDEQSFEDAPCWHIVFSWFIHVESTDNENEST